jgi:FtsP/CotA-like multicopper oxidase with cupredoxin domain
MPQKERIGVALLLAGVLAGIALLLSMPYERASAQGTAADAVYAQHERHLPPTRGSEIYQYAHPHRRAIAPSDVYDPTPPPPGPTPNGVREYTLTLEEDVMYEVAPGVKIPAWTFNRTVPGPVLRATEGETVRITLVNKGKLPHTIHFHGIHAADMDGVFELVAPGQSYTYEFKALPYGILPYHCHTMPTSQHIHNGLYGMLIVDPKEGRKPMRELAMVMSAFDLDRDGEADFYTWNGRAFQYADNPIRLGKGEPVRMYVLNMFEEAMVPHLHGNMYQLYPTGTSLKPSEYTDVKTLNIAERAILEFQYDFPGAYMFQCHVSEHMEQGLMGWFDVVDKSLPASAQKAPVAPHPGH